MVSLSHDARRVGPGAVMVPLAVAGGLLAAALAILYTPLWSVCWTEWWREESYYGHGILIPPLALLMIWQRRDTLRRCAGRPAWSGLALVIPSLALQLFAHWAHSTTLSWASFLALTLGGIAFIAGWRAAVHLLPPVLFLTFMVPMSAMLTQPVVFRAQVFSTHAADAILRSLGFVTRRLGTVIEMENYTLQVGLPCSGFKTLIALSAFAGCFVYLLSGSVWKKLLLFGAAIVLSLAVNSLRISVIGVTGELIGSSAAAWVHDNGGLPVTALALGGLHLLAKLLRCPLEVGYRSLGSGSREGQEPAGRYAGLRTLSPVVVASLVVLVGATGAFAARMPTVQTEARAAGSSLPQLALRLGPWEGVEQAVPQDVHAALPTAKIVSRRYRSAVGSADVTIITGSDATALHDPHDCLTGSGWQFLSDRSRPVDAGQGTGTMRVRDVVMVRGPVRARMWYWYAIGSDVYDSTLPARLGLFRARLLEGRRRRAEFVRLIVGGETDSTRTTMMLSDLARQIAGR